MSVYCTVPLPSPGLAETSSLLSSLHFPSSPRIASHLISSSSHRSPWCYPLNTHVSPHTEGCEVGQWSEWGSCTRRNKTCGFKWGLETRTRHIVKKPPKDTIPCPTIAESKRCKMAIRHCRRGKTYHRIGRQLFGWVDG
ncbi:unnamed protein product [Coregonus sp. 'balchen']|nr:unnamed protein product [Coregonus sp. 'balchen']